MPPPLVERSHSQSQSRHSSLTSRGSGPPSTSRVNPRSSQDTLYDPTPMSPFGSGPSSKPKARQGKERTGARSRLYESLLLGCELGFPLWRPSPRCTPCGEYILNIGDVGVLTHGLPFNTLFNITQSRTSLANRDGIPDGVDPPCVLEPRSITIEKEFHPAKTAIFQPEGTISRQGVYSTNDSSVFTFHLSAEAGSLLMLPQGGILHTLATTAEFKRRIQLYWRQWYKFAEGRVDLDKGQALYLVTGLERCSAWAMAAWDPISSYDCDELGSLELTFDKSAGTCSWAFPPARCSTQSLESTTTISDHHTVFIRGVRIDRFDGSIALWPPVLSVLPGKGKDGNNNDDSNFRGGSRGSSSFGDSSSKPSPSARPSLPGEGRSAASDPRNDTPADEVQILNLDLNDSGYEQYDHNLFRNTHPCEIINKLALGLVSKTKPALLGTGCVAFSHDEDWIGIIQDVRIQRPLPTALADF
ncbi:hypothetical protein AAF712_012823 [Marasmius tenuissimus]|uniref:Uncharacterized protein n=1 Tax=Marasmius tenuissimus TaxID=585030 RepID=A0ABR2ZIV6_9AGAR